MHSDFKELLSVLNERGVKYLVVGAYAVAIHAQPRPTKDLDIPVKADAANLGSPRSKKKTWGSDGPNG